MFYINTITGEYPVSEAAIRAEYPNTSFAANFVPPQPYAAVQEALLPEYARLREYLKEGIPVKVDETWYRDWQVLPLDPEVIAANEARALERSIVEYTTMTQQRLDDFARSKNYDNILSATTYATDPKPEFQGEGQRAVELRSQTWDKFYEIVAEIKAGTRPIPESYADIAADLPNLTWD